MEPECFKKNPRLKDQGEDGKGGKTRSGSSHTDARNSSKRRPSTDNKDDDVGGLRDLKRPTFMAMKASGEDVNTAFGKDIEGNLALFGHTLIMMATKTLLIRDAWIVNCGCAQHVCNKASRFV